LRKFGGINQNTAPHLISLIEGNRSLQTLEIEFGQIEFPGQFAELMEAVRNHPHLR
jgi:hypothetical protein